MNFKKSPLVKVPRNFLFFFFIALSFFLAGCFEYEETITIRQDGSGEMAVHYAGPADSDIDVDGFKVGAKDRKEMRDQIEKKFNVPGLRLKNYDEKLKGDEQHVYFTVAFDQFTSLPRARWWGDQQIDAGQKAGRYFWQRRLKTGDHDSDADNSKFGQWVKVMIADELEHHIKLRFTLETDGEIVEANSRDQMPHRVVWRFDGADLLNPEGLEMKVSWQ